MKMDSRKGNLKAECMNRLEIMKKKGNTNGGSCHIVPPFLSGFMKEPDPEESGFCWMSLSPDWCHRIM